MFSDVKRMNAPVSIYGPSERSEVVVSLGVNGANLAALSGANVTYSQGGGSTARFLATVAPCNMSTLCFVGRRNALGARVK